MADALRRFSHEEHGTWKRLFERQAAKREGQIVPAFSAGLEILGIGPERIPDLARVNSILRQRTGFSGVPVQGLEEPLAFFAMLARREFPVGNFIRDAKDLDYTPAPDVFHDLYGHLPFFADSDYADFCQRFGEMASRIRSGAGILRQCERFFWFTVEFGLVRTAKGPRVIGAGIASSFAECDYALGGEPELVPFGVEAIRHQEFRIDELQRRLFILESAEELYSSLASFEQELWFDHVVAAS